MLSDDFLAPRRRFSEPIPEDIEAERLLDADVDAHPAGDRTAASELIRKADIEAITPWRHSIMGNADPTLIRLRVVEDAPPSLPKDARPKPRMPSAAEKRAIAERDSWHCRFCGMPVIDERVRRAIRKVHPDALRWGKRNAERHAPFLCLWLQYDHVLPHSRGGGSSVENMVVTCAPCNYGRGECTLEEVGLIDPRTVPTERSSWDGLERFLST
ncbi:MAG: HNH endonuclease [Kiloniellaceae bacterium]